MLKEGTLAPYFILYQCFINTSSFDIFIVESICIAPSVDLILYVPVNSFSVMLGPVFMV